MFMHSLMNDSPDSHGFLTCPNCPFRQKLSQMRGAAAQETITVLREDNGEEQEIDASATAFQRATVCKQPFPHPTPMSYSLPLSLYMSRTPCYCIYSIILPQCVSLCVMCVCVCVCVYCNIGERKLSQMWSQQAVVLYNADPIC
jgi:hypothetical protein